MHPTLKRLIEAQKRRRAFKIIEGDHEKWSPAQRTYIGHLPKHYERPTNITEKQLRTALKHKDIK
ncbi:hypothetical protein IWQ55_001356 [Labrenzia sp. EL_208]|nr:hypothetical protein [Labrenzia sp. EL_132]MBG6228158.1 hypothetical protein [Labrenzia sp. EL_208]